MKITNIQSMWILIVLLGFIAGFICGMVYQQVMINGIAVNIASSLNGLEVNVNFNETKMMDALYDNLEEGGYMDFENETSSVNQGDSQ